MSTGHSQHATALASALKIKTPQQKFKFDNSKQATVREVTI